jgi:(+)-trans-carveol dehydrogenase
MRRYENKVALVTGAARGLGRDHAVCLAQEGADIIAVDICQQIETAKFVMSDHTDLKETVRLVEEAGRRIVARELDVRDFDTLAAAVADGVSELGRLDVIVATAGITLSVPLLETTEPEWDDVIDVNLKGAWHTVKASVPHMQAAGNGGSIILTSSVCGLVGVPGLGAYNASKHGVVGLMRTLANELGPDRIRVNTVNPGTVETKMTMNPELFKFYMPDIENPTREDALAPGSPMYEPQVLPTPWLEVRDITNAVLYLGSDDARFVTGVALPVDAGFVVKV